MKCIHSLYRHIYTYTYANYYHYYYYIIIIVVIPFHRYCNNATGKD